jgi:hypothetical protein
MPRYKRKRDNKRGFPAADNETAGLPGQRSYINPLNGAEKAPVIPYIPPRNYTGSYRTPWVNFAFTHPAQATESAVAMAEEDDWTILMGAYHVNDLYDSFQYGPHISDPVALNSGVQNHYTTSFYSGDTDRPVIAGLATAKGGMWTTGAVIKAGFRVQIMLDRYVAFPNVSATDTTSAPIATNLHHVNDPAYPVYLWVTSFLVSESTGDWPVADNSWQTPTGTMDELRNNPHLKLYKLKKGMNDVTTVFNVSEFIMSTETFRRFHTDETSTENTATDQWGNKDLYAHYTTTGGVPGHKDHSTVVGQVPSSIAKTNQQSLELITRSNESPTHPTTTQLAENKLSNTRKIAVRYGLYSPNSRGTNFQTIGKIRTILQQHIFMGLWDDASADYFGQELDWDIRSETTS